MFSSFRNRFGIPGVISVIALVFAMFGGAYAASNDNGGGKATASAKKGPRGPRGPKGPAGPAGPAGPQGPAGANGKDGANGLNGEDGEDGKQGPTGKTGASGVAGPTGPTGATGAPGTTGAAGPTGATGATGPEGSPWTAGGTLPSGKTETGAWSIGKISPDPTPTFKLPPESTEEEEALSTYFSQQGQLVPLSFPIPLAAELSIGSVHFLKEGASDPKCPGTVEQPKAEPGHFCVYTQKQSSFYDESTRTGSLKYGGILKPKGTFFPGAQGAGRSGVLLKFIVLEPGAFAYGSWAVTAP